jgi:uncharacterized protein (TIGR03435 family)
MKFVALLLFTALAAFGQASEKPEGISIRKDSLDVEERTEQVMIAPRTVQFDHFSMSSLVREAYGLQPWQLSHEKAPDDDFYIVTVQTPDTEEPTSEQVRPRLRALVEKRFKLVTHHELRPLPAYVLTAAGNGEGLKKNASGKPCQITGNTFSTVWSVGFTSCGIDALVKQIVDAGSDRPVVDRTGLTQKYDFSISSSLPVPPGLRVQPDVAPADVIVIDRAEHPVPLN